MIAIARIGVIGMAVLQRPDSRKYSTKYKTCTELVRMCCF